MSARLVPTCQEIPKGPNRRAIVKRIRHRAWRLAGELFERYASELAQEISEGRIEVEQIETWRPREPQA